jgi:hypothetical protein
MAGVRLCRLGEVVARAGSGIERARAWSVARSRLTPITRSGIEDLVSIVHNLRSWGDDIALLAQISKS